MQKIEVIKSYYEPKLQKDIPDHKKLGWESYEAQNLRFEILQTHTKLQGKKLLDVGCGLGNLLEYLNSIGINVDYTGVDILQTMIDHAKEKKLQGTFLCLDIFEDTDFGNDKFDVVYSSGIFNLHLGNNKEFLKKAVKRFFEMSTEFVAFNLLSDSSIDKEEDKYYYFSAHEVSGMLNELDLDVREINIVENYLKNDFTVIMRK